jgi:hypothetical protein
MTTCGTMTKTTIVFTIEEKSKKIERGDKDIQIETENMKLYARK